MRIEKDKKYFGIYLACVICATLLSIGVAALLIYFVFQDDFVPWVLVLPVLAMIGDMFAFNSYNSYVKTPNVVLEVSEGKVILTPDRTGKRIELTFEEIKGVELRRPLICRSGKRLVIMTEKQEYYLEDIKDLNESYENLVNILKGL